MAATELVAEVGSEGLNSFSDISSHVLNPIEREIPQLRSDDSLERMLEASVSVNVETILQIMENQFDMDTLEVPLAAAEYARRLAQRGVPVMLLERAYRIGHWNFSGWCFEGLQRQSSDAEVVNAAAHQHSEISFNYIDRVTNQIVGIYNAERDKWLQNRSHLRSKRIRSLLDGNERDIDSAETELGIRLRQTLLGVVCWTEARDRDGRELDDLEQVVRRLGNDLGCPSSPLFVPSDETSAWAWFAVNQDVHHGVRIFERALEKCAPDVRIAVGKPAWGLDGFRRTHRQALQAQSVALGAGPQSSPVMAFEEMGSLALMCSDMGSTRSWVVDTLGALAEHGAQIASLRETLRVYLSTGGSYTAAASRLSLHKNSVQYRVRKAEELLGRRVVDDRLELELALVACRWLGPAVLNGES